MPYTKTSWADRSVQYPQRFTRTSDGTYDTLVPAPGTITQSGTPITAAILNNLETQYDQAMADLKAQPAWINAVYQNSWTTNDSTPVAYFIDNFGLVHIRGSITGGSTANGTTIFTLPTGYRPQYKQHFVVPCYINSTTWAPCEIIINTEIGRAHV